jgi:hypothetical protein
MIDRCQWQSKNQAKLTYRGIKCKFVGGSAPFRKGGVEENYPYSIQAS